MANIDAAAEAVAQLAEKVRSIIDLAEALKGMASVEQAIVERKAALAQTIASHEAAISEADSARATLASLGAEHDALVSGNRAKAQGILNDAELASAAARSRGRADAEALVAAARAEAERVQAAAAAEVSALNASITAARQELIGVLSSLDMATDNLAAVQAATDAMKQSARAIIGG